MRLSLLIGLALIAIGVVTLYQLKNGFLMSSIAKAYYAPPAEPEALRAAFDELGDRDAAESGYLLKHVARARVVCTLRETSEQPGQAATEAFRRLNLMMLAAGVGETSPVVDPQIYYLGEIRRNFLRETAAWGASQLPGSEVSRLDELFEGLTAIKHPVYADLPLAEGFNHFALRALVEALRRSGEAVNECVATGKNG